MAAVRGFILAGVFCVSVFCIFSWKYSVIGVQAALQLAGRGLLFLALAAWMVSSLYPKLKSFLFPASPAELENPVDEASSRVKQERARKEQQERHIVKSSAYQEAVLKPRQEAVRKKKEEDFYRMTGQTWKLSQGFTLGEEGETEANTEEDDNETPNQKAARRRKQLETPHQAPVQKELPKEKKIIILPDEPPENTEGVLRIALRCPSGRTLQRRFFKTCSSSVLLDWLHKSGYSPTLYALYTSYPRMPLLTHSALTMEDVGIVTNTILNVEEKDPSTT
ncbi:UBX domain-containing protein 8 [Colossoma macropomum]|uniref:UBX domain-containing protein 8 n=1 Tax=Colossoma macropomum TaxID=42526 RepID=UPI001863B2FA|nr:UBX domain-containing protein 8 [Colossoma macropomum]